MKNEIDNKRQDAGNALPPSLCRRLPSHTAYLCAKTSIANFPYDFKGNIARTLFLQLYFQRCRNEKSCAAFLLFISTGPAEG